MHEHDNIDKAIRKLTMPMHITDPETRISHYCAEVFNLWNGVGHENPEKSIIHFMRNLYPKTVKEEMQKCLDINKLLRRIVVKVINEITSKAASCQSYIHWKWKRHDDDINKPVKTTPQRIMMVRIKNCFVRGNHIRRSVLAISWKIENSTKNKLLKELAKKRRIR